MRTRPNIRTTGLVLAATLTALVITACGADPASGTLPGPSQPPGGAECTPGAGNTMSGTVTNSAGQGVPGARVHAGNTLFYNDNVLGTSDASGRYCLTVPGGSWLPGGQVTREYHGQTFTFDLAPNDPAPFAGSAGARRDFRWVLTGPRPDGGTYGGTVTVYADFFDPELHARLTDVELTLTPDGPIVDGSAGRAVTARLGSTQEGQEGLRDVPIGRYRVTARFAPNGATPAPMTVKVRNTGEFAPSVTADFRQNGSGQLLELEVAR
ncbi:carboxypeptidase-like regulatory domain-containing protein [Deinococcus pimensis]|uniref:carboxypeptidase-like regulatory domain-containing protein n=1 Tax=Deinococcus pimensis TaxID=309888 RepID=UPI0004AE57CE|nr:carboxypeptidase-like regulatory domain-containing protein [Deinococcus pimensis]